ncbi:hypothetical protein N0V84_000965 [Fusarium piperis]|uniref:Alginate lyase domain-containing protein n=1 Tax=Fusarium piperis TaxID=1435070 RepID=A0A9W8WMF9_9HYPO|nr:hypothetical protein N0V84_000965 [Fusarium piperis]
MKPSLFTLLGSAMPIAVQGIVHPGLLHTEDDFTRIRGLVNSKKEPFATGWQKLARRADANWKPSVSDVICRGQSTCTQNIANFFRNVHVAYANAVYWKVTGDTAHAEAAARIIDAWSEKAPPIQGSADRYLAAGIQGYQLANAAEILRGYEGWTGYKTASDYLVSEFYGYNHWFLTVHNGAPINNYWANWDLCNIASMYAIGVFSDNQTMMDEATEYFKHGPGMGSIENALWFIHEEEGSGKPLAQCQESGRDQAHTLLDMGLLGTVAQQSYNQGDDLFAYLDNRILAGAEYTFKYNSGNDVPFKLYYNSRHGTHSEISTGGRGGSRPVAEMIYAHYASVKGLNASWTGAYRDQVVREAGGAEGGGGDYGPNSGGYDQLGFGTILFRRE